MNKDLQRAQDMLGIMQSQRDQALNASVLTQAEIMGLRRQVSELEAALKQCQHDRDALQIKLDEMKETPSDDPTAPGERLSKSNPNIPAASKSSPNGATV